MRISRFPSRWRLHRPPARRNCRNAQWLIPPTAVWGSQSVVKLMTLGGLRMAAFVTKDEPTLVTNEIPITTVGVHDRRQKRQLLKELRTHRPKRPNRCPQRASVAPADARNYRRTVECQIPSFAGTNDVIP